MLTQAERETLAVDIAEDLAVAFKAQARVFVDERLVQAGDMVGYFGVDPCDVVDQFGRELRREARRIRRMVRKTRRGR